MHKDDLCAYWLYVDGTLDQQQAVFELLIAEDNIIDFYLEPNGPEDAPFSSYCTPEKWGSVSMWSEDELDTTLHCIATKVPDAVIEIECENTDDHAYGFSKRFHGDLFQESHLVTNLPPLIEGADIPFDQRNTFQGRAPTPLNSAMTLYDQMSRVLEEQPDAYYIARNLMYLTNNIEPNDEIPISKLYKLAERMQNISTIGFTQPFLNEERLDAIGVLLENGLRSQYDACLADLSPDKTLEFLLTSNDESFAYVIEETAAANQEKYAAEGIDEDGQHAFEDDLSQFIGEKGGPKEDDFFTEGTTRCISIKALYELSSTLTYGSIIYSRDDDVKQEYFDLYNQDGQLACLDGEECKVKKVNKDSVVLTSKNTEFSVDFVLTHEEAQTAFFSHQHQRHRKTFPQMNYINVSDTDTGWSAPVSKDCGYIEGFLRGYNVELKHKVTGKTEYASAVYVPTTLEAYYQQMMDAWGDVGYEPFEMERSNGFEPTGRAVFRGYFIEEYDPIERENYVTEADNQANKLLSDYQFEPVPDADPHNDWRENTRPISLESRIQRAAKRISAISDAAGQTNEMIKGGDRDDREK